ncbi:MAG: hypothetical protein IKY93_06580 [Alistipes sp.]|nr:hypothetical protein [Alistipes sp.]
MNRRKLISAVQGICNAKGYEFRVLDSSALSAQSPSMPAAVLIEPKFQKIEGRKHGKITYRIVLYLFENGARLAPETVSEKIVQMENNMLEMFMQLSESEPIAVVDNLQMEHALQSKLGRAEIALKATADVVVIF